MFLSRWMLQMCISAFHKLISCVLNLIWLHSIFLHVTWSNFCCMQSADTRVDLWWGFLCEGWKLAGEIADWTQMTWRAVSCGFSGEVITAICLTLFNFQGHFHCIGCPLLHPDTLTPDHCYSSLFSIHHPCHTVMKILHKFHSCVGLLEALQSSLFLSLPRSGGVTCSHVNLLIADCSRWNFGQKRSKVLNCNYCSSYNRFEDCLHETMALLSNWPVVCGPANSFSAILKQQMLVL